MKIFFIFFIPDCEQSPGVYLRDDPLFGTQLQNQSELRVPNAEKAAFYLDAAVNSRSGKEEGRDSHFLYTLHVYQYSVAGKGGGKLLFPLKTYITEHVLKVFTIFYFSCWRSE